MEISIDGVDVSLNLDGDFYGEGFWRRFESGSYEPDTLQFIRNNSNSDSSFIDIGAANGAMTLLAARYGSTVYSFEPNPIMFSVLNNNLAINNKLNNKVKTYQAAVSISNGEMKFSRNSDSRVLSSIVFSEENSKNEHIKVLSLSDILKNMVSRETSIVIKMDIEGAEWRILGDHNTLSSLKKSKAKMLLAVHPGFYRPHRTKIPIVARLSFEWFRFRNILDSLRMFKNLSGYATINRTNLVPVQGMNKFAMLIAAGYHEFIIDFSDQNTN